MIWEREIVYYGEPTSKNWIIQPVNEYELSEMEQQLIELERRRPDVDYFLIVWKIHDWNAELSPWKADAVFGTEGFAGEAQKTLYDIERYILPYLEKEFGQDRKRKYYLVGYSLAGLFALWAMYESNLFDGVAAVSPSVWFPGWIEYADAKTKELSERNFRAKSVYLSLGDKEEKTRNPKMATVGKCIREQYELLHNENGTERCILEWNPGNHFKDGAMRLAKGIAWIIV